MIYLSPVIRGIPPPAGGEILIASARCILHQHCVLPRFPGVYYLADPSSDLTGIGDVSGTLEGHCLEDDEPLRFPAVLKDSPEFYGQRLDEAAPDSLARCVIPQCGHHCQVSPSGLPHLVSLEPPTEVCYIVGLHPVPIYLLDPLLLCCGHIPRQIPCRSLPVLCLVFRLPRRRRFDRVPLM